MRNIIASLEATAGKLESLGMYAEAASLDIVSNSLESLHGVSRQAAEQDLPEDSYIFPSTHASVKDGKHHFPIDTAGRARNALARAGAFDKAPKWFSGSLSSFKNAVKRAVKIKAGKRGKKDSAWDIEVQDD